MQIIIDIDYDDYRLIKKGFLLNMGQRSWKMFINRILLAIANGKPIEEGDEVNNEN